MKRLKTDVFAGGLPLAFAFAVWFGAPAGAADDHHFSREKLERVGDYIRNEIATGKIPGAVILIQQHGQPVYYESFGVRDVATQLPMTPDTIFRLYSMSKPITSVAAMMLVEDGKLSLGDPVSKHIPAFGDIKVALRSWIKADRRSLRLSPFAAPSPLRICCGIRRVSPMDSMATAPCASSMRRRIFSDGDLDNAEFAGRIAQLPLQEQPGTLWDYGHSTDVLGRVIEVVSGQSLFQFEKERLLDPLGMTETAFFVADEKKRALVAEPMPETAASVPCRNPGSDDAAALGIRRCRHGWQHYGLRAFRADAAERRRCRWQALSQA